MGYYIEYVPRYILQNMDNTSRIPTCVGGVYQPDTALESTSRTGSFNYTLMLIRIVLTKLTLYHNSSSTNNFLILRDGHTGRRWIIWTIVDNESRFRSNRLINHWGVNADVTMDNGVKGIVLALTTGSILARFQLVWQLKDYGWSGARARLSMMQRPASRRPLHWLHGAANGVISDRQQRLVPPSFKDIPLQPYLATVAHCCQSIWMIYWPWDRLTLLYWYVSELAF